MTPRSREQGQLEQQILNALWLAQEQGHGPQTSQQVLAAVSIDAKLALTTVLTVLSRLVDKELVTKTAGEGRALLFAPTQSREEHGAAAMLKAISGSGNPALAFAHFANGLTPAELEALKQTLRD